MNDFIELRDAWGNYTRKQIQLDQTKKLVKGLFKIGLIRKLTGQVNKNSITNTICAINILIPCTVWPVTNPIIKKISKKIDPDKIGRKINCWRIRFR